MIFETQRVELTMENLLPHCGEVLVSLKDIYSKDSCSLFPDEPGIYFVLLCEENRTPAYWDHRLWKNQFKACTQYEVLYIGKTLSLRERWKDHHRIPQFLVHGCKKGLDSIQVSCMCFGKEMQHLSRECSNTLLLQMERECIEHFKPVINRTPVYDGGLSNQEIVDLYSIPLVEEYSA